MLTSETQQGDVADAVTRAALEIVDEGGYDLLSMRRLSSRVNMHLPALYRLFSNKQALVDEMADIVLSKAIQYSSVAESSDAHPVAAIAHGLRRALLEQRDGARIVGGSYGAKRNNLALIEMSVDAMRRIGFSGKAAVWAASTVFCYVLGEVIEQQGAATLDKAASAAEVGRSGAEAPPSQMDEAIYSFDERFAFGLDTLLAGLKTMSRS